MTSDLSDEDSVGLLDVVEHLQDGLLVGPFTHFLKHEAQGQNRRSNTISLVYCMEQLIPEEIM